VNEKTDAINGGKTLFSVQGPLKIKYLFSYLCFLLIEFVAPSGLNSKPIQLVTGNCLTSMPTI
jgi:hypothetical protein